MLAVSILSFISAILISLVSAYYSIVGLTAIFPASIIPIIIMGIVLEIGKLTSAIWLHSFWNRASYLIKTYLSMAVIILMFITSLGIFGFLSKSHIEHMSLIGDGDIIISQFESQIERQRIVIKDNEVVLSQLDDAVKILQDAQRIRGPEGALAVRESQKEEREMISNNINSALDKIQELEIQKSKIVSENAKIEAEVGPIRYVAELIYGPNPEKSLLEEAVRWLIILIVVVFDPLAICLILAGFSGLSIWNKTRTKHEQTIQTLSKPQSNQPKSEIYSIKEPELKEQTVNKPKSDEWLDMK